jgi:hypothetical protein
MQQLQTMKVNNMSNTHIMDIGNFIVVDYPPRLLYTGDNEVSVASIEATLRNCEEQKVVADLQEDMMISNMYRSYIGAMRIALINAKMKEKF